jgi:hypothetical protein
VRGRPVLRSSDPSETEVFTVSTVNQKQPDQNRIIASLATECHVPMGEMTALYEHERAELALGARVTTYLHIFATRKVLELLQRRERDQQLETEAAAASVAA